jgi:hypothetical protein
MSWTITWPEAIDTDSIDLNILTLCEVYAAACMNALTLHRVGGDPVTIMPRSRALHHGYWSWDALLPGEYPLGSFHPGTLYPSAADLVAGSWFATEALELPGPVGQISAVTIDGEPLGAGAYRVENGRWLVRLDGGSWPCGSDGFTVTYFNSHPVGVMGAHAAGIMAAEWLKLITGAKGGCRLPPSITSMSRQGIQYTIERGMFPDGVTGIPEIDAYLMLWNPYGLKTAPKVYSPDRPASRQIWHA